MSNIVRDYYYSVFLFLFDFITILFYLVILSPIIQLPLNPISSPLPICPIKSPIKKNNQKPIPSHMHGRLSFLSCMHTCVSICMTYMPTCFPPTCTHILPFFFVADMPNHPIQVVFFSYLHLHETSLEPIYAPCSC